MWSLGGIVVALGLAVVSWQCSRATGGSYARETYGMDARAHRRYGAAGLLFALYFSPTYAGGYETAGLAGLALFALTAVFYAASFLQGAPDE